MAIIKTFHEILAWQKGHNIALEIYTVTSKFSESEKFGLVSQMRRCAVSIPSNIAEGFKRKTMKDSVHFYNISEGSLEELKYQLLLSKDLGYINGVIYKNLTTLTDEVGRILCGWIKIQK